MKPLESLLAESATVLAVGAHPDDIEIGAGATLLRVRDERPDVVVHSLVMTATEERAAEARAAAAAFVGTDARLSVLGFRDGYLPWEGSGVKESFARAVHETRPEVVLVPATEDAHQDHRLLGELAIQVARSATIVHYEIPKYDGDLGRPNVYVPVPSEVADRKVALLHEAFPSQTSKDWFDEETLRGVLRVRGVESRQRYAEAFVVPKLVIP